MTSKSFLGRLPCMYAALLLRGEQGESGREREKRRGRGWGEEKEEEDEMLI